MSARDLMIELDESHTYRVDGVVVPGVTEILRPLHSWENVPQDRLDRACALGRAVHLATEFDDRATLDESSLSPEIAGYLEAWRRFRRERGFTPEAIEHRLFHPAHRYAGTLDRAGELAGQLSILDLKSGERHRAHGVQIAAYAMGYMAERAIVNYPRRHAVYLHADGRYECVPFTDPADYPTFLGMRTVFAWRQKQ